MNKKKLSTLLFYLSFFLCVLNYQHVKGQAAIVALLFGDQVASEKFNISLEIGGAVPFFSNLENNKYNKLGINFGIGANLKLSDNWYFSPNIYFLSNRSTVFKDFTLNSGDPVLDSKFTNTDAVIALKYIDIPVFISYQTNNEKYRFSLAPQVSFLKKSEGTFSGTNGDFKQNFDSFTNNMDYGALVDIGYILGKAHKGKGAHIHLRYYQGFATIFNSDVSTSSNRSSYISLHLSLPFITEELAAKNLE